MAAVMDLDLNCAPPEPEPAPAHAMLRQEHAFRHKVEDLHRLYWAQRNLPHGVPFWEQSHDVLYPTHPMPMATSSQSQSQSQSHMIDPHVLGASSHGQGGKQAIRCGNNGAARNLGRAEGSSVGRKPEHGGGIQGRSGYRRMIDLEKPATSEDDDDDVEILSPAQFSGYANRNAGFVNNSQCYLRENAAAAHVRFGSIGSSDTPESQSPVKAKATESGRMLIDLNIAQEDDLNVCPDSSKKVFCSRLASSSTMQSGECCSNSSKAFHMGGESSIGSSKGSSITFVASTSAPDSAREVMARGICDPQRSSKPFHMETSNHDMRLRGNILHQHTLDNVSGMSSQASMEIPREEVSIRASGRHSSSPSGLRKLGGPTGVYRECQEESLAVICDDEMEGFDLNVSVGSIELPSMMDSSPRDKHASSDGVDKLLSHYFTEDKVQENISSVECPTIIDQQRMAESMDGRSERSPDSGVAANRSMSIPETPQGRDYACPRLRTSSSLDATNVHHQPVTEDELIASTAAETLVSLFTDSAAWITDSYCSNNQVDVQDDCHQPQDDCHEPQVSLDSFEEGVMNLEALRDDGDSVTVRAPDKDGPSCGIKLRRGRGMRDFQREILPGLVSLARHEICDDLHAIGYEIRKTRQRRAPGDKYGPSTRSRLPRRCSNGWN